MTRKISDNKKLYPRASRCDELAAKSLMEWLELYRRNPAAVPYHVEKTLRNRGLIK